VPYKVKRKKRRKRIEIMKLMIVRLVIALLAACFFSIFFFNLIFDPEDWYNTFLRNVGAVLLDFPTLQLRIQYSPWSLRDNPKGRIQFYWPHVVCYTYKVS
jgi:hypothetical protein